MSSPSVTALDDLLRHAGFLRDLARDLCRDASRAEDLEQDVWLCSLNTPPRTGESPRGWLATIARRLASNTRRGDRRRLAREAVAAGLAVGLSPDEVMAREQIRDTVLHAVLALDEPFREAVLLRFYEGLAPRDIAARLGIPAATVRTRIARGVDRLRNALDARSGGDRASWMLALSPWTGLGSHSTPALLSALVMKKLAFAVVALVLVAITARLAWTDPPPADTVSTTGGASDSVQPRDAVDLGPEASGDAPARTSVEKTDDEQLATPIDVRGAPRVFPAVRRYGSVFGEVLDTDGMLIAGVEVEACPDLGNSPPGLVIEDDREAAQSTWTDADGRFEFASIQAGPVRITARSRGMVAKAPAIVSEAGPTGPLRLGLQDTVVSDDEFRIEVTDPAGAPVAGCVVELFGWSASEMSDDAHEASFTTSRARAITTAAGSVQLHAPGLESGVAVASAGDGRTGQEDFRFLGRASPRTLHLTITAAARLRVHLRGLPATQLEGARLSLHALASLNPYYVSSGRRLDGVVSNGIAEFDNLPAGTWGVALAAPLGIGTGVRLLRPGIRDDEDELRNAVEMPSVAVAAGASDTIEFTVTAGGAIRGHVTVDGRPVQGARVRAVIAPRTSDVPAGFVLHGAHVWRLDSAYENAPYNPVSHVVGRTGPDGRYALVGLAPGDYRVEVASPSLSFDRRMDVAVRDGTSVDLEHELALAGVLQVATLDATYLGVTRVGETTPVMLAITRDAFATFPGLAAGSYVVSAFHSNPLVPTNALGTAKVVAGRTTWLDLREASVRAVVRGRVLSGTQPITDASVRLYPHTTVTDADGSFRLTAGHLLHFHFAYGVQLEVHHGPNTYSFKPAGTDSVSSLDVDLQLGSGFLELAVVDGSPSGSVARVEAQWSGDGSDPDAPEEASVRCTVGADGRVRLGPFPPGGLHGTVVSGDGARIPFTTSLPRPGPLRIERPPAGTLRVTVLRAGRPARANVWAATWTGLDPAPTEVSGFQGTIATADGRTAEDGTLTLTVVAGVVRVDAAMSGFMGPRAPSARIVIQPGGQADLTLELK